MNVTHNCPCRRCSQRSSNCHGSCIKYKSWQKYAQDLKVKLEHQSLGVIKGRKEQ